MVFRWLEDRLTFKPGRDYCGLTIPKCATLAKIAVTGTGNRLSLLHYINPACPSVLVINCHGNRSNLGNLDLLYQFYKLTGVSYLMFDYPGYGESSGKPNEQSLYTSLSAIIEYAVKELKFPPEQIVLHGISLGGAVAIDGLSKNSRLAGAVIDASFTNTNAVARHLYRKSKLWLVSSKNRFNSLAKVSDIRQPMLFIHGLADLIIPYQMSCELYDRKSTGDKSMILMPDTHHVDEKKVFSADIIENFSSFVRKFV